MRCLTDARARRDADQPATCAGFSNRGRPGHGPCERVSPGGRRADWACLRRRQCGGSAGRLSMRDARSGGLLRTVAVGRSAGALALDELLGTRGELSQLCGSPEALLYAWQVRLMR